MVNLNKNLFFDVSIIELDYCLPQVVAVSTVSQQTETISLHMKIFIKVFSHT